jgi:hypothetical protein
MGPSTFGASSAPKAALLGPSPFFIPPAAIQHIVTIGRLLILRANTEIQN